MNYKKNKYNAKKVIYNGIKFDSKKECNYYKQLLLLQKADEVIKIELQPRYDITIDGKYIAFYKADFRVLYVNGKTKIIDVKGYKKGCAYNYYRLKKKLVEKLYNIEIIEV